MQAMQGFYAGYPLGSSLMSTQREQASRHFDLSLRMQSARTITDDNVHMVYLPRENTVYSGGDGRGQTIYAEYTADSTAEDPIVLLKGTSLSGAYETRVHLNDVDPSNASYAELCALIGHLKKTGAYHGNGGLLSPVPLDVNRGNVSTKRDYRSLIERSIAHNRQYGNLSMAQSGEALLSAFDTWMDDLSSLKSYLAANLTAYHA